MTNKEFAQADEIFRAACEISGAKVTSRQASKYRNGRGLAFPHKRAAQRVVEQRHTPSQSGEEGK